MDFDDERILVFPDALAEMLRISRRTLRRWVADGRVPKPIRFTNQTAAWHVDDLQDWLDRRHAVRKETDQ